MFENRSLRLKGYDYTSTGDYFVTIITKNSYVYSRKSKKLRPCLNLEYVK